MPKARKRWIAVGIVIVVLVVAGFGFNAWHQQPSFCSALCHKVMAPYVDSWEGGDQLARAHAIADIPCLECHKPTFSQQLSEVSKYVTGNYTTPLAFEQLGTSAFCLSCHGSYAEIAKKTPGSPATDGVNPHETHLGEIDCYKCHRMHQEAVLVCDECHTGQFQWDVP